MCKSDPLIQNGASEEEPEVHDVYTVEALALAPSLGQPEPEPEPEPEP